MVYRSRVPEMIDLLRQCGRIDLEPWLRRGLQAYWPDIRAAFHNLLTLDQQTELLERFVFSLNFICGTPFPGDIELDHMPMLPDPADGGYPAHSPNDDFILFGIPPLSIFANHFRAMQARERRLYQRAMQVVPTISQSHIHDNRRRADGPRLEPATLRSAILRPQTDDSRDHDGQDAHDQYDDSQQDHGQDVDRQDDDGSTAPILAVNSAPEDDDICPICREEYSDAQPPASLIPNCGHFFHLGCMVQWINSDPIDGKLRDRCIYCRRQYTGILSQLYGEVTPPQNGENFWRNDNGPLISEVFPRRVIPSPRSSSDEYQSSETTLDENIVYGTTGLGW
ncbi:hypothetical protein BELL_1084g00010 [Botrytis elliptica]|uniref:RING-type E3 ubiquitin transferase n=1 Tax=Botrytis elliptica TaxID=278938 RepID=A0A4Z1INU1_9HELO|nr:hypothetical protein EAE99_006081 [Botrytis elliptica]TGO63209.1 hypothetical protein BELL_1084g00010 [Botrytis elliptica]